MTATPLDSIEAPETENINLRFDPGMGKNFIAAATYRESYVV